MAYRELAEVAQDHEPERPRLSFYKRWQLTIFLAIINVFTGLFIMINWTWITCVIGLLLVGNIIERRWLIPERQAALERQHWLANLPRTPDGGVLMDREGFDKHF